MKILFMLPSLSVGGLERVQVTIANALARRGHDVTVETYGKDDTLASELLPQVRFRKMGLKPHPIMKRIPWVRSKFYDDGMWEKRTSPRRLHAYYVDEDYDVEVGFFRGLSIKAISGYKKGSRAGHIAWVHNDFRRCGGYMYEFKSREDVIAAYKRMDAVICVSEDAKSGFIDKLGDTGNLKVLYNPLPVKTIEHLAAEPGLVTERKHKINAVIVGRLIDGMKGQTRMLEAVAKNVGEGRDIGLTIVGGGPDEQLIKKRVAELGIEANVEMVGEQRNPYPYIRQADLLVCASHYEGYNLTVAEALILGTPVLSTRCTGPVEILADGEYGMIVENSTEGLTEGLRRLASDPSLLAHYAAKAKERRPFFDEDRIICQIESLFKNSCDYAKN